MPDMITMLAFVPVMVVFAFSVHWGSVAALHSSAERLPACRFAYLGYSFLMLSFSWLLWIIYGSRAGLAFLMPLGAAFAFGGDFYNLQFEVARHTAREESVFGGILFFTLTQGAYSAALLARKPLAGLVGSVLFIPVASATVVALVAFFALRVWNPARPRRIMIAAFAYGLVLAFMASVAITAAIVTRERGWILIALGAASFVFSDLAMGGTTIRGRHPVSEFQVPWFAYLIAQGSIQYGYALILR